MDTREAARRYVTQLARLLQEQAHPENAIPMKRYMKDRFEFFGIKTPERKALARELMRSEGIPEPDVLKDICYLCFEREQREFQYFVNDICGRILPEWDDSFLNVFDHLIGIKSWWDTVDFLAPQLAGRLLLQFPNRISEFPDRWIESPNFWYQRAAILFQLTYKDRTDPDRLFRYILRRADSEEFFVQKGAGWALRQYSRIDADGVMRFVRDHKLPALTAREGLKWLKDNGKL